MTIARAGALLHRVDIVAPSATVDKAGRPSAFVAFQSDLPARVVDQSGREVADAQRIVDQCTHVVILRGKAPPQAIKTKMRVLWLSKTLEIRELLNPDGRGFELRLICVEVADV